jgi:glutamate/tyrosine decarboxylase-like PLP-dependent enzyme
MDREIEPKGTLTPWKSWFLGPKSENADLMERLMLEVFRDHVFWRRNFHPEDEVVIQEIDKRNYEDAASKMRKELFSLLAQLKAGVPFFSPRYVGHMLSDVFVPAMLGYFAGMLYNPNNVTSEVSPVTARLELECTLQLARLVGYIDNEQLKIASSNLHKPNAKLPVWGHLTSGGTVANLEALWVARNLKYFPLAVKRMLEAHKATLGFDDIEVNGWNIKDRSDWSLLNLPVDTVLGLRNRLIDRFTTLNGCELKHAESTLDNLLRDFSLPEIGWTVLSKDSSIKPGVIIVPATAHYSIIKIADVLGLGRKQIRLVDLDDNYRMNPDVLDDVIRKCVDNKEPIIAVITVFGTTEEGSVDEIGRIIDIRNAWRKDEIEFFLHCDAAYGGYACSILYKPDWEVDSGQLFLGELVEDVLRDLEQSSIRSESFDASQKKDIADKLNQWKHRTYDAIRAIRSTDSVTIDPHKLGYVPYPAGAVVFRSTNVRDHISCYAPYLFHGEGVPEYSFIGQYILEGSKPGAAAAACWLAHQVVPLNQDGYGALLRRTLEHAKVLRYSLKLLESTLGGEYVIEPINDPDLNILCFVINAKGNNSLEAMNQINNAVYARLSSPPKSGENENILAQDFFISKTDLLYNEYRHAAVLNEILARAGVDAAEFGDRQKISVLRCALMNPWLSELPNSAHRIDYLQAFLQELKSILVEPEFDREIRLITEIVDLKRKIENVGRKLNVLLVENEQDQAERIQTFLAKELPGNLIVHHAHNKVTAYEIIERLRSESLRLDLAIIDIHLGEDDPEGGESVAADIAEKFHDSPRIYLTGPYDEGQELVRRSFQNYNMWGLINKHEDPDSYQIKLKILHCLAPDDERV